MVTCAQHIHSHDMTHTHLHLEFGSECFEEFLTVLGEKIRLKGWERFRGGLDVKGWYLIRILVFGLRKVYSNRIRPLALTILA